jgi:hypothetical protein
MKYVKTAASNNVSNFGCLEEFAALKIANPKMQLVMYEQYFINCDMFSH